MNPYAGKLKEFPGLALDEPEFPQIRGNWGAHFRSLSGRVPKQLVFEIGCSNGLFLVEAAKKFPEIGFLGIDWKFKVLYRAAKRAVDQGVKNAVFLRGRAQKLAEIFAPGELDEALVLFPDPWAKTRQTKHRLLNEQYFLELHTVLSTGGRILWKTDHPGYFQWVLAYFGIQPEILDASRYEFSETDEKSKRVRQERVRGLARRENLPKPSEKMKKLFSVHQTSSDFWSDLESQKIALNGGTGQPHALTQVHTLFERLFILEKLPIYFAEFRKFD